MKSIRILSLLTAIAGCTADAGEPTFEKQAPPPTPLDDRWRFSLASPGWLAGLEGDVGINGVVSHIDVDPGDIIRRIDMAVSLRGEASKGRFGVTADFLYLSLSDSVGTDTVVKKLDLQVDEIIGDVGLRWRVLEGGRGYLDVIGGVRYVNLFQQLVTQANDQRISEASTELVDKLGGRLRTALSDSGLRQLIADSINGQLDALGPEGPTQLPIGPLGGRIGEALRAQIASIIQSRRAELSAAVRANAQTRVREIKREVSDRIARVLSSSLATRVARTDDWYDPYIGLRGRYNLTDRFYATAKGDIGGFGVGSDLTWQAEAALGFQITANIFAEAGYRALGIDYEDDGLIYDTTTHGAQVTVGITF